MEGPSIRIACDELNPFLKKRVLRTTGIQDISAFPLKGKIFSKAEGWGKHLLLHFGGTLVRIHFLMFGSYRIDNPRPNRNAKLVLHFKQGDVYFYSCAIKPLEGTVKSLYDFSIDLMSSRWDLKHVLKLFSARENAEIADALMDQNLFAGLGNIMKNEILFRRRLHPEMKVGTLTASEKRALVKDTQVYAKLFYDWKKLNVLKRNWQIFRKKKCPKCGGKVTKRKNGKLDRVSHYCSRCQPKRTARV